MDKLDFVKKTIIDGTIVRDEVLNNEAIQQYYNNLVEALQIDGFPLISINTIEKKTYMIQESCGQCYLVFDHYLLDCMHLLNQFVFAEDKTKQLETFFYKTVSEECYTQHKISSSINFAGKYMQNIDYVIKHYMEEHFAEQIPEYLFVQQAFLIAHELFHFYLHKSPEGHEEVMSSKAKYLRSIYEYVLIRHSDIAVFMEKTIKNPKLVEECLCDSTAVIQAIDVGIKAGKLDVAESGLSAALALMNQYIISTIQDTIKHSGDISYERLHNLFNFRLLHIKAFTEQYIKEYYSNDEAKTYQEKVENIHGMWMNKVYTPIMYLLVDINPLLKEDEENDSDKSEEIRNIKNTLKRIYNS